MKYWHSVTLDRDLCKGCTNCIKMCPTLAIRVRDGKAKIIKERCIDCGECIRVCPYHAKKAVTDSFDLLNEYKYNIALVAPAFYGQFSKADHINVVLTALVKIGFDSVYDVARGAETITKKTRELLASGKLKTPAISSACPAVLRLIAVRFPNLIEHIVPLKSPMEVSATAARAEVCEKTGLAPEEVGVFFISPCAAKATDVKGMEMSARTAISGVISIKDTYLRLAHKIGKLSEVKELSRAGAEGVRWATHGGEAAATHAERCIAVDGIHNVIRVLENIEDGKMDDIQYVEALSCTGGCVGGPLTAENNFVANARIKRLSKVLPAEGEGADGQNVYTDRTMTYIPVMHLDDDMGKAMEMAKEMERIYDGLPQLDCGSCGAPSCRALAEDIVRGFGKETDCIFKLRERVRALAKEMMELEGQMPASISVQEEEKRDEAF